MRVGTQIHYSGAVPKIGSPLISKFALFLIALSSLAASSVLAQTKSPFAGARADSEVLRVQEKVNQLFEQGEYERAYFIYRNELTPAGDKYAQYMVGYMLLTGTGVPEDPVHASAWYRLAAERANPQYRIVRDQLLTSFDGVELGRSDQVYLQLRREYADAVILLRAIESDLKYLRERTGSRLSVGSGPVTIVDPRTGGTISGAHYYRRIRERIESRLKVISDIVGDPSIATTVDRLDLHLVQSAVEANVDQINDR